MLRESFENIGNAVESEVDENKTESSERDPKLVALWKKYKFMGEPPVKGSPVESRLFDICERYSMYDLGDGSRVAVVTADGENYFARKKSEMKSDSSRRELHNQIALMTTGKQRSTMDETRAIEIANFACEFVHGNTLDKMIDKIKKGHN